MYVKQQCNKVFTNIIFFLQHDLIVDKFPTEFMNTPIVNVLPFPLGDYQFHSTWIVDDISRAEVRVYGTLF